tara:strand:+ start:670 stop:945 length:276 start_codon:yes stop_codon:yes gene_type:complete
LRGLVAWEWRRCSHDGGNRHHHADRKYDFHCFFLQLNVRALHLLEQEKRKKEKEKKEEISLLGTFRVFIIRRLADFCVHKVQFSGLLKSYL